MANILIIEDDRILRDMYADRFLSKGYSVRSAVDGEEGLTYALEGHPDIILLDLAMPKMDGMQLLKKLRKDPWGKDVVVVILSNLSIDDELLQLIRENRPAYYLMKIGVTPEYVLQRVEEILSHD